MVPLVGGGAWLVRPNTHGLEPIRHSRSEGVATTTGAWASMIHVTRVASGNVIVVDLGWSGDGVALREALASSGAVPAEVDMVLLTHSHRDHIAAWPLLRHATFVMAAAESATFVGGRAPGGPVARLADAILPPRLPRPGELVIRTFSRDTQFVLDRDTVRAYAIPGHTPGSAAYLVGDRLFLGDAMNMQPLAGFRRARWAYSDDVEQSTRSVRALWARLPVNPGRLVCTAHAKCAPDGEGLRQAALR